jgi:hypothetical protein
MQMNGRNYQAGAGSYKYSINGQEKEIELNKNITSALYWEYDSRLGRRWNIDPVLLPNESPYLVNGGNTILYLDPLGDFKTKFGAQWNKFWHGGDKVGKNKYGEWYVSKKKVYDDGAKGNGKDVLDEVKIGTEKYYGKGRRYYTAAAEKLGEEERIKADIQINGENSRYQIFNSDREAGLASLSYVGLLLPNPIIRSGTIASNVTKAVNQTNTAVLKNGYYEVNGFKFTEYYYNKLWNTGRGSPSLIAREVVQGAKGAVPDAIKGGEGFFKYEFGGWEMVYNPTTKEVWHLQPIK